MSSPWTVNVRFAGIPDGNPLAASLGFIDDPTNPTQRLFVSGGAVSAPNDTRGDVMHPTMLSPIDLTGDWDYEDDLLFTSTGTRTRGWEIYIGDYPAGGFFTVDMHDNGIAAGQMSVDVTNDDSPVPDPGNPASFAWTPNVVHTRRLSKRGTKFYLFVDGVRVGLWDDAFASPITIPRYKIDCDNGLSGTGTAFFYLYAIRARNVSVTAAVTQEKTTVTMARKIVRESVRTGGAQSGEYTDSKIDHAVISILSKIAMDFRYPRQVDSVPLIAGSPVVDLSALYALGFERHRILSAYLDASSATAAPKRHETLALPGFDELRHNMIRGPATSEPRQLAFESPDSAAVWPTPDKPYVLKLEWYPPAPKWIAGAVFAPTAAAVISSTGTIAAISVLAPGGKLASAPAVTISGDGSGATATASIDDNGQVYQINITAPGSAYTYANVAFSVGQSDPPIRMDSDLLYRVLSCVGAVVQYNEPTQMYASQAYKNLVAEIQSMRQVGSTGAKTVKMNRLA